MKARLEKELAQVTRDRAEDASRESKLVNMVRTLKAELERQISGNNNQVAAFRKERKKWKEEQQRLHAQLALRQEVIHHASDSCADQNSPGAG